MAVSSDAPRAEQHESTSVSSITLQETEDPKRSFWKTVVEFLLPDAQARLDEYEARIYRRIEEATPSSTRPSEHRDLDSNETGD